MSKKQRSAHEKQMLFFTLLFGLLTVALTGGLLWLMNAGCAVAR